MIAIVTLLLMLPGAAVTVPMQDMDSCHQAAHEFIAGMEGMAYAFCVTKDGHVYKVGD